MESMTLEHAASSARLMIRPNMLARRPIQSLRGKARRRTGVPKRTHLRQDGRDTEVNDKVSPAQVEAMEKWGGQRAGSYDYLKTITHPTSRERHTT